MNALWFGVELVTHIFKVLNVDR